MLARLALLFVLVPAAELALLYWLAGYIGFWPEIALIVLTGLTGAALAKYQGAATLRRFRADAAAGRMPADAAIDGVLILVAGAFLLTPGLMTDVAGFSLLIPGLRRQIKRGAAAYFKGRVTMSVASFVPPQRRPDVVVVEPNRLDETQPRPGESSPDRG
ncbi:FxsA family protein [Alienimonas californiensis]|uniref:Phage T7 F exclusion suppressor FxsA n=1 Tax=Alienimonas californiensis TaxID=2527989 RepID=A0A517P9T7_9PLAN|nr:FxsA family protein [Alienimonas californiensis]QDT16143.1 phage T7 F exclusion suppressor FxsA [Alienimonas californiensis]